MTPDLLPGRMGQHVVVADGHWLWTGAVNNKGYGQVVRGGRTRSAHRVAFEALVGQIPDADPIACPRSLLRQFTLVGPAPSYPSGYAGARTVASDFASVG